MVINNVVFNTELPDILNELVSQLRANNIDYIQKTKETSTHIQIQCPYHGNGAERRPSAGIRKEDGVFHCFACQEIHSLPEVISYCFGYTDDVLGRFGWNWLLKNFATVQAEERKDVDLDFGRNTDNRRNYISDNSNHYISEDELDSYRYIHPYMYKRGLTNEIIELFDIGFDKNTNCITFPVRDISGRTLFIARRSVVSKFFNYPQGVEKPLYGLYEFNKVLPSYKNMYFTEDRKCQRYMPDIIVTESMLDALSFWTVGKYAVALNGLGNELQFKQLRELPCRKIILATDMDEAGQMARKRIRSNMQNMKIITEYRFPQGRKDANECTKEELMNLQDVL